MGRRGGGERISKKMDKKERRVVVERVAKEKGAYKGRKTEGQGEGRGVCRMKKKSVTHVFPAKKKQDPTSGCLVAFLVGRSIARAHYKRRPPSLYRSEIFVESFDRWNRTRRRIVIVITKDQGSSLRYFDSIGRWCV